MKQLKYVLPIVLLVALVLSPGCNRSDDPMVSGAGVNPRAFTPSVTFVDIDILPHQDDNRINCLAEDRILAVAILSESGFDATAVDHTTVTFEGASEVHLDPETSGPKRHEEDVDGDGDIDLVFHFRLIETSLNCDATEGTLEGNLSIGTPIEGIDDVEMFKRDAKKIGD